MLTSPLNLPAPGRRQSVYINLTVFARTCVFDKQSLPSLLCDPHQLPHDKVLDQYGSPFSRSYGGILPSSLTIVHPNALVSSTRPPVSVSGTGRAHTSLEAFLDSTGTSNIPNKLGTHHASPYMQNGFTYPTGHTLTPQSTQWP